MRHSSLWLFSNNNLLRRLLFLLTMDVRFRCACVLTTVLACAALAVEAPGSDPRSAPSTAIGYVDWTLNVLFAVELAIKARRRLRAVMHAWLAHRYSTLTRKGLPSGHSWWCKD